VELGVNFSRGAAMCINLSVLIILGHSETQ
jgi:hypothetical protein